MSDNHPSPSPSTTPQRNWLELPRDLMLTILSKLTILENLKTAHLVCKAWHALSKDPSLWRTIQLHAQDPAYKCDFEKLLIKAVGYSDGQLLSLDIEGFGSPDMLSFVVDRASQLKHLRLACCYGMSAEALIEASGKLSYLEELELTLLPFTAEKLLLVIRSFTSLKTFKLNEKGSKDPVFACDEEARAISASMPGLCHLQLIGNSMTNDGLVAILDSCPRLESLDLRACFQVDLSGGLGKRCAEQIKNLLRPEDPTDDYIFLTTDYDTDFDDIFEAEYDDLDLVSDNDDYEFSDDNMSDYVDEYEYE